MSTLNKVMLIGRLGSDPEVRYTQNNTAVANISLATNSRYKDNNNEWRETTEWHKVVAWGKLAEICQQYLTKGSQVYFEGSLQTRSWEDRDGQKRYTTEIKASEMVMLDSKGGGMSGAPSAPQAQSGKPQSQSAPSTSSFEVDPSIDDDDLPF